MAVKQSFSARGLQMAMEPPSLEFSLLNSFFKPPTRSLEPICSRSPAGLVNSTRVSSFVARFSFPSPA